MIRYAVRLMLAAVFMIGEGGDVVEGATVESQETQRRAGDATEQMSLTDTQVPDETDDLARHDFPGGKDFVEACRNVLTPEQFAGLYPFLETMKREGISGSVDVVHLKTVNGIPGNPQQLINLDLSIRQGDHSEVRTSFYTDRNNGQVYMFMRYDGVHDEKSKELSHAHSIPKEDAFHAAAPYLALYGLSAQPEDYSVDLWDNRTMGIQDDLWGAVWSFWRGLSYKGLPCRQFCVHICVSADLGVVDSVRYCPVVEPPEPSKRISREEALDAAKKWAAEWVRGKAGEGTHAEVIWEEDAVNKAEEVIILPRQPYPMPKFIQILPRYCWEIPMTLSWMPPHDSQSETARCHLGVDIETGEVIGLRQDGSPRNCLQSPFPGQAR